MKHTYTIQKNDDGSRTLFQDGELYLTISDESLSWTEDMWSARLQCYMVQPQPPVEIVHTQESDQ